MKFLDEAKIYISSGHGGAGSTSFRREKFIEFGGPDGGKGGRGGHVFITAVNNLNTLIDFRYSQHFKAERGGHGMGKNCTGKDGQDIIIKVPVGTQIFAEDKTTLICDMIEDGQTFQLARGGDGGQGNQNFKTSTNRSPQYAEPGWPGEELWVWLRMKLIADVGLAGLPNAGKSSLLNAVSRARAKVADYPFTTLAPQLGVVEYYDHTFIIADIPGLIENAHQGSGLGHRFLGHIERCQTLIHLIDASDDNFLEAYHTIVNELEQYDATLAQKPRITVLNKIDLLTPEELSTKVDALKPLATELLCISVANHNGIKDLIKTIFEKREKSLKSD